MPYEIHPDVAAAATLPAMFYTDPAAWATARERIFARSWQWIGDLTDVAEPGSLSPREMLAGCLDEPVLLVRDDTGRLRCLSNVCTHRGNLLVREACRSPHIRCGYHARRFDLQGRMQFMPEFQQARNFPSANDHLAEVPLAVVGGQAFAGVAPAAPAAEVFGDLQARLAWLPWQDFRPDATRSRDYEMSAHWALYVENYLEGLHIPFLHQGLMATLDFGHYRYELYRHANLQLALAKPGEAAFDPPAGSPDHGQRVAAYYWWVFPNLMLNFYPWGLSLNLVQPLAPDRTRVLFRSYVHDASLLGQGAGGDLHRVEMEDEAAVEAVQRGIRSRFYRGGRYSPTREQGVHHFHRLIAEHMA